MTEKEEKSKCINRLIMAYQGNLGPIDRQGSMILRGYYQGWEDAKSFFLPNPNLLTNTSAENHMPAIAAGCDAENQNI